MGNLPFKPPAPQVKAFNCPYCNAYANQEWGQGCFRKGAHTNDVPKLTLARCVHCTQYSLWLEGKLIYPDTSQAPLPNSDLPEDIKNDFEEARSIINRSPRGAAALLRLCIQKLCKHLGESGKNINSDIASLVKKGLSAKIQKSLDIVRVIGNEAIHPGTIDLRDDIDIAIKLCQLVNIIADAMITHPKLVENLYNELPDEKRIQIEQRDK